MEEYELSKNKYDDYVEYGESRGKNKHKMIYIL